MKFLFTVWLPVTLFLCGCNNPKENNNVQVKAAADTTNRVHPPAAPKAVAPSNLKSVVVDEDYFTKKTNAGKPLSKGEFQTLNLSSVIKVDAINEDEETKLKIIDTLMANETSTVCIVSRETENENWAWLVQFDHGNKILFAKEIYYADFVEYMQSVHTTINKNRMKITTTKEGEESKKTTVVTFKFADGRFLKE